MKFETSSLIITGAPVPAQERPPVELQVPIAREADAANLTGIREKLAHQTNENSRLELERLKKLLAEQELAGRQIRRTAAHAQRQLKTLEADNARVRSDLQRVRQSLTEANQLHAHETRQGAARELSLSDELVAVRSDRFRALEAASGDRKKWIALCCCIAIFAVVGVLGSLWKGRETAVSLNTPLNEGSVDATPAASRPQPAVYVPATAAPHDISGALGRLEEALGNFKDASPETILQRVHQEYAAKGASVCSFEWNGGQVSLLFGSGAGNDPASAVTRCADAVENFSNE